MSSAFQDQIVAGIAAHEAATGQPVTYSRKINGVLQSVPVTASVGNTLFKQTDTQGRLRMQHGERDYLIRASTLILNGETILPQSGDQILDSVDGKTYTVAGPGIEPVYRNSDAYGIRLRIHCKLTG